MRNSYTAVVERLQPVVREHATEPYEAAWADEALVFVKVRGGLTDGASVHAQVQISPDGIDWLDFPGKANSVGRDGGLTAIQLRDFGTWLRVVLTTTQDEPVRVSVSLALKG
jgi:hypothetical protein